MKNGKPTVSEILELVTRCENIYAPLWEKFEEDEKFYELDFQELLDIPKEFQSQGIVLPTGRDVVDAMVDHVDVANARVFVNRKGTSNVSAEEAEILRKLCLGLIYRTNVESDISPWRASAKHTAIYGMGVLKTVWTPDLWPDKPIQKSDEFEDDYAVRIDDWRIETSRTLPITIQAVNPHCVMPDPYGGHTFVIERQTKLAIDVWKKWTHWGNPLNKKIDSEVDFISYWDNKYRCDLADGEPLLKVKTGVTTHNYGFPPYVVIDAGLGNISYENKIEMRYVGLLRYIFDLLIAESRDFSIADIVLSKTAWPWGYLKGPNAKLVTEIKQTFGTYTPLPDGVEIVEMVPRVPPDALNQHYYRTADAIAAHAAPRSIRGLPDVGVRSAAQQRQLAVEASARYQYACEAFKNATAKVLGNCATLIKNVIPGNVRVWTRTPTDEFDEEIDKKKLHEPFNIYVEFSPISEEDEYRRHDDLERLVTTGIGTKPWARRQMSNVDPVTMELEEEKERLRLDPQLQMVVSQYAAGKMAEAISKRELAEVVSAGPVIPPMPTPGGPLGAPGQPLMGQPSVVPGGMTPPIPQTPQPGSAQALQLALQKMRSQTPVFPGQGVGGGGARI